MASPTGPREGQCSDVEHQIPVSESGTTDINLDVHSDYAGTVSNTSNITGNASAFMHTDDLQRCLDHMTRLNCVILTGMSGIGKTEIAKKYWHTKKSNYDVGWLIPSKSNKELRTSIFQFLEKLDAIRIKIDLTKDMELPKVLEKIHLEISGTSTGINSKIKYLLIFDDVREETHQAIVEGFPSRPNIAVIITTQQSLLSNKYSLELKGFTEEEALKMLHDINDSDELKHSLWEAMSHLPSALVCAGYDIKKIQRGIRHYIKGIQDKDQYKSIEKRDLQILGISYDGKTPIEAHVSNAKTMLDELKEENESLCFVLKTIGFFNSKDIPEFILRDILRQRNIDNTGIVIEDEKLDYLIDQLVTKMQARSYVTLSPNGNHGDDGRFVDTHDLVQLGIRYAMEEKDEKPILETLMRVLLRYFAKDTRYMKFFSRITRLMPHVETVLDHFEKLGVMDVTFDMKVMAIAMNDILGYSYTQKNFIDVAEEKLTKSVDMLYKVLNIEEQDLDRHIKGGLQGKDRDDVEKFAQEKAKFIFSKLKGLGDILVDKLVLNTVLNTADVNLIESKLPKVKLPKLLSQNRTDRKIYDTLVDNELAISEEIMKTIYLPELFASVLYSHGRMYFYKSTKDRTNTFISNLRVASALCEIIQKKMKCVVLHRILTQRNGLMYLYSEKTDEFGEEKDGNKILEDLYKGKSEYEKLRRRTDEEDWYQYGILKVTQGDSFHKCKCLEKIIYICTEILKLETSLQKREGVVEEGRDATRELMDVLDHQEKESKLHKASNFYSVTAKFYDEAKCWDEAFNYYTKTIDRCKHPDRGNIEWKKYGECCLSVMRVARNVDKKEKIVKEFFDAVNTIRHGHIVFRRCARKVFAVWICTSP
ncbi:unnamed protein product [Owenia fusiformis]|uniref:NB-ARC domain-containing protein n=1 Tax=Owenia fusiformis TaxID=6347 RepID=A0A8S4N7G6_OWEFU|nr:unnamed protein product [Owenia fusiformis]